MDHLYGEALERFQEVWARARERVPGEPDAMTLATAGAGGRPSARTVLLKQADERGFVFYTNLTSRKGRQLEQNPRAALCFFWQPLREQVLVEGSVEPVAESEADAYWASRPRMSQLGAWASEQSRPLDSRESLERRLRDYEERYRDAQVPRPPHWSGLRVVPDMIEFWASRPGRLHDRVRYCHADGRWQRILVNP